MAFIHNYLSTHRLVLVMGDGLIALAALWVGFYLRFQNVQSALAKHDPLYPKVVTFTLVCLFTAYVAELYNGVFTTGRREISLKMVTSSVLTFFILSSLYYLVPQLEIGRGMLIISLALQCIMTGVWHYFFTCCSFLPSFAKRVLILGTGKTAELLGGLITLKNHEYVLAGYINSLSEPMFVPQERIVGEGRGIAETTREQKADKLVISLNERRGTMSLPDILEAKFNGVDILDGPTFYEMVTGKLLIEDTNPSWFIFSSGFKTTPFKRLTKSALDRLLAGMGLLITMPLFPVIALLIKYNSPGPIFFKQSRVGEGERNFFMYKFRTMYQDAESLTGAVWAQENDPRITGIGRILRKTRLDEIPQLYNVLKGEMSLVGPRPERPEFVRKLKEIIPYYSQRHFSKPGITGWAQIRYPYGASVEDAIEKLRYDLYYIKHMSLIFDLLILLETAKVALLGRGAR